MKTKYIKEVLLIIILILVFGISENVFAEVSCHYSGTHKDGKKMTVRVDYSTISHGITTFKCGIDGLFTVCSVDRVKVEKNALFVEDNNKVYCPSILLMEKDDSSTKISGDYTISYFCDINGNTPCFLLNIEPYSGSSVGTYNPILDKGSDGKLYYWPCHKDWDGPNESYKQFVDKIDAFSKKADNSSNMDEILNEFTELEAELNAGESKLKNYCAYNQNDINSLFEKLVQIKDSAISRLQMSGNMTSEEIDELNNKLTELLDGISSSLGAKDTDEYNKISKLNCSQLIDDDLKEIIIFVMKISRILVPILLILLVAIDFSQVVISNDKEAVPKAVSKAIKRAIAAVVVFFIPTLVITILNMPGIGEMTDSSCLEMAEEVDEQVRER